MKRTAQPSRLKEKPFVAFDFETTNIPTRKTDTMRVELRYLTAFADDYLVNTPMRFSRPIYDHKMLADFLASDFFTLDRVGTRYIAWNANRFDYRPIIETIVAFCPTLIIQPYEAGSGPRGFLISERSDPTKSWEICDGIAMTGCVGMKLKAFLAKFAPDLPKGEIDFDAVEFDPERREHVAYAERDSEGLYRAMCRVDGILRDLTGRGLQVTIGNLGIKFFQQSIPPDVMIWKPHRKCVDALQKHGTRGGFCYTSQKYRGPLWTYDRNQEYSSIMRTNPMPCGRSYAVNEYEPNKCGIYYCRISNPRRMPVPFYCSVIEATQARRTAVSGLTPVETCLLSVEIETLRTYGWDVTVHHGWYWDESFTMEEMVNQLEALRSTCDGGPSGPVGTMAKMIGNHSFGKTLEQPRNERIVICAEDPSTKTKRFGPWFPDYIADGHLDPNYRHYWYTMEEATAKLYHRPQIGAFITAGARCDMFALVHLAPEAFIKVDTDSVAFTRPIAALEAQCDPVRYGAMKKESDGDEHIVLGKKGYYNIAKGEATCKGLYKHRLTQDDFERWFDGEVPVQAQIQSLSWRKGLSIDAPQYRYQERRGTDFDRLAQT